MWLRVLNRCLSMGLCLLVMSSWASADDWELKKDRDGIQIYTRSVEGSKFKQVKATGLYDVRLSSMVALIRDGSSCTRWADLCKEVRLLDTISDTEQIVYNFNDIPWPVKDRDAITRVLWEQDADTLAVTMRATAIESDLVPASKKAVRLSDAETSWVLTPQANGSLEITSIAHIDPAGPTPAWMTNLMLVDSPYKTMISIREEFAETDRYEGVTFPFVQEPSKEAASTPAQ